VKEASVALGASRLYSRDLGAGTPLVVLHGGPEFDHNYLVPEIDLLGSQFRLITYDQRGRGRSAQGVQPEDVDLESEISDVEAVRMHFGFDRIAVLGHSWGGLIAAEYAIRYPARVSHLILMNSAPLSHRSFQSFRSHQNESRTSSDLREMQRLASTVEFRKGEIGVERDFLRLHFKPTVRDSSLLEEIVGRLRVHFTSETLLLARSIGERLSRDTWMSPDYNRIPALSKLSIPILVLHGEHDSIPVDLAEEIAASVPWGQLTVVEGAGHFAFAERSDEVVERIVDFVG
jgi:proline iminopeptidase